MQMQCCLQILTVKRTNEWLTYDLFSYTFLNSTTQLVTHLFADLLNERFFLSGHTKIGWSPIDGRFTFWLLLNLKHFFQLKKKWEEEKIQEYDHKKQR